MTDDFLARIGAHAPDAILITDSRPLDAAKGGPRIVWCNAAFSEMTGFALEEIAGQTPRILQGPETDRAELDRVRAALEAGEPVVAVVRNYTRARQPFFVEMFITPLPADDGTPRHFLSIQRDVTNRVERERNLAARAEALAASERMLQEERVRLAGIAAIAEHAQELITITDLDFRILWANRAFAARAGFPAAALRGLQHCDIVAKTGVTYSSREAAAKAVLSGSYESGLTRNTDRDGQTFWTDISISLLRDAEDRPERFIVIERDVTTEQRQSDELERRARELAWWSTRDTLTGLFNRRGFHAELDRLCAQAASHGHGVALLLADIDRLKQINGTLGHKVGDAAICAVARRLESQADPDALVGRLDGNQFALGLLLRDPARDLDTVAERLAATLAQPVRHGAGDLRFTMSVGHVRHSATTCEAGRMMIEADIALGRAKDETTGGVRPYDEALAKETRRRRTLADELQIAVENGDLLCHYQPQFDAEGGELVGVEALVRWSHPRLGLLSSDQFVPLAQELGLEGRIDRIAMETALGDRALWSASGLDVPKVSVNVSALRLRRPELEDDLAGLEVSHGELAFELLESISLETVDDELVWVLDMLRERGIGIEIDDFGTGHASVMGLVRVAPDRLKIDRGLLAPAEEDTTRRRLFELMVETGKTLGIAVTAEGVETEAQARIARQAGCAVLQGYLYDGPLAPAALLARYGQSRAQPVRAGRTPCG